MYARNMASRRLPWLLMLSVIGVLAATFVATRSSSAGALGCHLRVSLIARGQGSPDDLAWEGKRLLVSDIVRGTVGIVERGHVTTLVGHINVPEGIVDLGHRRLVIVEQNTNRLLLINLKRRLRTAVLRLPLPHGKSGVDNIKVAPGGGIYVPDSANGRLFLFHLAGRHLKLLASGMSRPVDAVKWGDGVAVAEEYGNVVSLISGRQRTQLAQVPLPDDLTVVSHHLLAISLAGAVWEVAPHLRLLSKAFHDPQGMVTAGQNAVVVADQSDNAIYRVSGLATCL